MIYLIFTITLILVLILGHWLLIRYYKKKNQAASRCPYLNNQLNDDRS
jgi:cbb3-type cytochrome oxidase subunit 3